MNRHFTRKVYLLPFFFLLRIVCIAQPEYSFKNPVLKSGIPLLPGAVYKFSNVKPGVDANITVLSATGGVTLTSIDENWTGFDEAFQPFINVLPLANGYVEFKIDFLQAGTETLKNQANVPTTCIDVDGVHYSDGTLYEQDQVQYINGYYDFSMTGSNIQVLNPAGWLAIKNTSGNSYDGIDTAQKDVMATVVNLNISSLKIRIGALNTSFFKSEVRYRSVYFKRFSYANSILLPNRTTVRFSGSAKNNGVELKGALSASHTYDRLIIERSTDGVSMFPIAEIPVANTHSSEYPFTYFDNTTNGPVYYYRLRLVNTTQRLYEISNTIMVKFNGAEKVKELQLVNTLLNNSNPVLTLQSTVEDEAAIQLTDMSGRLVLTTNTRLFNGINNISLTQLTTGRGYYIITVATKQTTTSRKVIIQ
jgi:hypothetical protein